MGEYKVYKVGDRWEIFWCPSAPVQYTDRIPYDGKLYTKRPAAYRRVKQLSDEMKVRQAEKAEQVA